MMDEDRLRGLVDWESGVVSPEIFIDEEVYRAELDRLFSRTWLFLAHDSMIPNPGDFFSTYMGSDPVIVARQGDGSVTAYLNVCRHRGMKVCRAEDGNAGVFMCTYHGWTYDISGALVSVPNREDAYHGELDLDRWGLVPVAQVDAYKGLIFGNFDPSAPPLIDYLGDMAWYIDGWVDHAEGGIEVLPGVIKWTIHGNWKMAAEQFAGDGYHAQVTHASSLGEYGNGFLDVDGREFTSRLGHGHSFLFDRTTRFADDPLGDYNIEKRRIAIERLGPARANTVGNFTTFPNFSGLPQSANIRVWHPKGPNKFEIWSWTVVERDAPEHVKRAQQRSSTFTEGAAGTVETDDGENWDLIGQILDQGHQVRKVGWNYQMGLGHERDDDPVYPGRINPTYFGEGPQRGFYRRWLEFMTSEKWPYVDAMSAGADARGDET
jgi:3-phenylpropionate/trans-cinnamate dioxygenase subunit alpha